MGHFITFEGGDGSGKTTQSKMLFQYMKNNLKENVIWSREPGGCETAENIRSMILNGNVNKWHHKTELLLMNAARVEHLEKVIKPALQNNKWIICDRYFDSSLVYQGYAHNDDIEQILLICNYAIDNIMPKVTFLLDLSPECGLARKQKEKHHNIEQRFENKGLDYQKKVREGFIELSKKYSQRYVVIDANNHKDDIFKQVVLTLKNKKLIT